MRIEERNFKRLQQFSHGTEDFVDWSMEFKTVLGTRCPEITVIMEAAEIADDIIDSSSEALRRNGVGDVIDEIDFARRNAELYDVLFLLTSGEARLAVKGVESRDGVMAWQKVHKHFSRRTLTTALRLHREAMHPETEKDITRLAGAIVRWEGVWRRMEKESGVTGAGIPDL